jgi:hypothetical protein
MALALELIIAPSLAEADIAEAYRQPGADVHHLVYERFGIDEARRLKLQAEGRPLVAAQQVFVIFAATITGEAQNALLKLFEEPPATTRFILIIPRASLLLPTLQSRFVTEATGSVTPQSELAAEFLALSLAERLEHIASRVRAGDQAWARELARSLGVWIANQTDTVAPAARSALVTAERYLELRGASKKALLEHLALALPVVRS